ncbi:hypothetical protein [Arsenicicoccus piscis]|uniref:Glycogen debranching enzyme GlgX n=1 Tax=Arsenicicoccus piscis TaxID=673954 RepID=A0ABQ6HPV8_9MICO|nr:hypothetical protein GCM10025862_22310 [Arsenicicoccus piscis]
MGHRLERLAHWPVPPPFAEWNDRYRDTLRNFWLIDLAASSHGQPGHRLSELATRLAGSEDSFSLGDRGPIASINFVTAHDGFTLADLTRCNVKHNGANGEGNRDGMDHNRSWNHGVEGRPTTPSRRTVAAAAATSSAACSCPPACR